MNSPEMFVSIPAPVHRVLDDRGPVCYLRLSEYVKPDELNPVSGDLDTFLGSCLGNPLVQHCLHTDWNFAEIQRRASRSHWHQAPQRKLKIRNAREYFARVVLELDTALRACWPNLSTTALQAFWTSWEVSEHLTKLERRIEEYASEPGAVSADRGELGEAQGAIESIIRHYVIECLEEAASEQSHLTEAAELIAVHNTVVDVQFASEAERTDALAAYVERWACSEASLARTARVNPADLSKWKKGRLPVTSDKKARIEKALRDNEPPTQVARKNSDS